MVEYHLGTVKTSDLGGKPLFAAYLALSGGRILIPDAVSVTSPPDDNSVVQFLDAKGGILAVFRRVDIAYYTDRPEEIDKLVAEEERREQQTPTAESNA